MLGGLSGLYWSASVAQLDRAMAFEAMCRRFESCRTRIFLRLRVGLITSVSQIKARVAELVDALDLGSSARQGLGVQVPPLVLFFQPDWHIANR